MGRLIVKIILGVIGAFLLAALIVGALAYRQYRLSVADGFSPTAPTFELSPASNIMLGKDVRVLAKMQCPWGYAPVKATLDLAKGLQSVAEPVIRKLGDRWGKSEWEISAEIQPYRTGEIKPSKCSIEITGPEKNGTAYSKTLKASIPGFKVLAVDTGGKRELDIAGEARPVSAVDRNPLMRVLLVVALVGLLALALAGVVFALLVWKKKREMAIPPPTPWEIAIQRLDKLAAELGDGSIDGLACVAGLTDIIRLYLEERFSVPTTTRTTQEFLLDLERGEGPLGADHRLFLRDFMSAAELVKFAKLPADETLLLDALAKARRLVESTIPEVEDEQGRQKEKENV